MLRSGVSPRIAAHRLTRSVVPSVEVRVPGSEWVYPSKLEAVQAGDDVLVYADLSEEEDRLDVELVGPEIAARRAVTLARSPSPLLADAWSGARATWLIDQARGCDRALGDTCDRWRARAVEFSRQHRIVNETTAMVVLGTADDYARFGLKAPAPRCCRSANSASSGGPRRRCRPRRSPSVRRGRTRCSPTCAGTARTGRAAGRRSPVAAVAACPSDQVAPDRSRATCP